MLSDYTTPLHPCIHRFSANTRGRDFAVGDVHGSFSALDSELDLINFDRDKDRLFAAGNLVEPGPSSSEVDAWLDKPWFTSVQGNHDMLAWRRALGNPYPHAYLGDHGDAWLLERTQEDRERIGQRLRDLPMVIEIETADGVVGIVHAEYPFENWRDLSTINWADLDQPESPAWRCLWSTDRMKYLYSNPIRNLRAVVHGHVEVPGMARVGNAYYINAKAAMGRFTLLELGELVAVSERPTKAHGPWKPDPFSFYRPASLTRGSVPCL